MLDKIEETKESDSDCKSEESYGGPLDDGEYKNARMVNWLNIVAKSRVCIGPAPRNKGQRQISSLIDDLKRFGVKDAKMGLK